MAPPKDQKVSVKGARQRSNWAEGRVLKAAKTTDSFQNFQLNLGVGTANPLAGSTYGFNPITRIRTLLEWIYRGSWIGKVAVDIIADDMTKEGIELTGSMPPEDAEKLYTRATQLGIWKSFNETVKWSRLYGGCLAVYLIDGQDFSTPLNIERISRNSFKGLLVMDRWMVDPTLEDLVSEFGPQYGKPRFYRGLSDAPGLRGVKIHHSRCVRLEGCSLPYWQALTENLWGVSVYEPLYDRMMAFDSATTGAAQSVYKAFLRTVKIDELRNIVATGGAALQGLQRYISMMAQFQSIEGITILDKDDEFEGVSNTTFTGMGDIIDKFGDQICGALQIPRTRMFGASPGGLNSTGDGDNETYYGGIKKEQETELHVGVDQTYRLLAISEGIKVPDDFGFKFKPLWEQKPKDKAEVAEQRTRTILAADEAGHLSPKTVLQELQEIGRETGVFASITDEMVEAASEEVPPGAEEMEEGAPNALPSTQKLLQGPGAGEGKASDRAITVQGLPCVVEHDRGTMRYGGRLPAAYGYIRRTRSAEGDDQMDAFFGPAAFGKDACPVHVIDSYDPYGNFDEHKVCLGYSSAKMALDDFHSYYSGRPGGPDRRHGKLTTCTPHDIVQWLGTGQEMRPFADCDKSWRRAAE